MPAVMLKKVGSSSSCPNTCYPYSYVIPAGGKTDALCAYSFASGSPGNFFYGEQVSMQRGQGAAMRSARVCMPGCIVNL